MCEDKAWAAELFEKLVGCWGRTNSLPAVTQLSLERPNDQQGSPMPGKRSLALSKYNPSVFIYIYNLPLHLVVKLKLTS